MSQDGAQSQALEVLRQVFVLASQGRLGYGDLSAVAKVLVEARNFDMARHLYTTWLTHTSSSMGYIVHADFGDVLIQANDIAGARAAYQSSLQLNGGFERARTALAKLPPV